MKLKRLHSISCNMVNNSSVWSVRLAELNLTQNPDSFDGKFCSLKYPDGPWSDFVHDEQRNNSAVPFIQTARTNIRVH